MKYILSLVSRNPETKKLFSMMRKIVFLLIITSRLLNAGDIYPQNIKLANVTLGEAFQTIEQNSEFVFIFRDGIVDLNRKVDLDTKDKTVYDILNLLFESGQNYYEIVGRQVVILEKENKEKISELQSQPVITISGTVADESGLPLPGVNVIIKGTKTGTVTDSEGKYILSDVPVNAVIQFSFMGMKTQEVQVEGRNTITVTLVEEQIALEEVVAVGYGTRKKENLTGSISTIRSDKLNIAPMTNVTNALSGQLPGLITKQSSGQPGFDDPSLSIRGFGSPLVIVDGVEAPFNALDASQIESISILKDGAASIYGARAGNGVILVTTKRGLLNQKPVITLNSAFTLQGPTNVIRPMSSGERAQFARETHINAGLPMSQIPYTEEEVQKYFDGSDPKYLNTDWYDAAVRTWAPQYNANLSINGGSDKIKYYGYFGYNRQETMVKEDGGYFERFNIQSNVDSKITESLTLSLDISLIFSNSSFVAVGMGPQSAFWSGIYWSEPRYPLTLPDPTKESYGGLQSGNVFWSSRRSVGGYSDGENRYIRGGGTLAYDFKKIKGLKAKAFINYNYNSGFGKSFVIRRDFYTYDPGTQTYTKAVSSSDPTKLTQSSSLASDWTQQYSLVYERVFNQIHRVSALALYENINYDSKSFSTSRSGFPTNSVDQLFAGDIETASNNGSASEMGRASWVGRINYAYNNRYMVETILRYDASAKFPPDSRWGLFPSVSLGWIISQENFMKSLTFVDILKLRGGYGQSGNDAVGSFQYLSGYQIGGAYMIGDALNPVFISTGLANPFLTWEKIKISNVGVDFSFFNRKINGTAEVFYRLRDGIPANRLTSLPSTFGASLPQENLNSIDDRGFELTLGSVLKAGDFSYDISGNISWSRSKWVKYEEPEYADPDQKRLYQNTGQWTDRRFGYVSDGLFTSQPEIAALPYIYTDLNGNSSLRPGDVKYLDINNDGVLDWKDQRIIGQGSMPHWMYGINATIRYKNFDLNLLFQGAFGFSANVDIDQRGWDERDVKSVLLYDNRWTEENNNPNAKVPRPGGAPTNLLYSDYRNHPVRYLRLKSISLGYDLPQNFLNKLNIKKMRVFVAGTNLITLSSLNEYGVDPEMSDGIKMGNYYPQQRTVSVGLNLSF